MSYNQKTRTITIEQESDAIIDLGPFFIDILKTMAKENCAPPSIIDEWKVMEEWLGSEGRALNEDDNNKISSAWQSFIAKGDSPSIKLQPSFTFFSQMSKEDKWELVDIPKEVEEVFRCQVATKEERDEKDILDFKEIKELLESLPKEPKKKNTSTPISKERKIKVNKSYKNYIN